MSAQTNKDTSFKFRLSKDERRYLSELAKYHDRTPSDYLRRLIRLDYDSLLENKREKAARNKSQTTA